MATNLICLVWKSQGKNKQQNNNNKTL